MKILTRDQFATAVKELVVENFGSEEAFIKMWNDNIDAQEALEKEEEQE
jgi:hypothetical protein